jgi:hypothetical protein
MLHLFDQLLTSCLMHEQDKCGNSARHVSLPATNLLMQVPKQCLSTWAVVFVLCDYLLNHGSASCSTRTW